MIKDTTPETDKSAEKTTAKVFVNVDTTDEQLLDYDRKGLFIVFEVEEGRFKNLADETLRSLKPMTRAVYRASEAMNEKIFAMPRSEFDVIGQGGALDEQYGNVELVNKNNVSRYSRKDLVYKRERRGWKVAGTQDVAFASSRREGGHFETKDPKTGQTDQVLMIMPKERYQKLYDESRAQRAALSEGLMDGFASGINMYPSQGINEKRVVLEKE